MRSISEKTSKKIYFLGFICAILVMTIHCYNLQVYEISLSTNALGNFVYFFERFIAQGISRTAVPLFFVFASFLYFINIEKGWYLSKSKKRIKSLLIPFIIWNLFSYLIFLLPKFIPFLQQFISDYNKNPDFLDFINAIFFYKYNYAFWFVYELIFCFIISPIFYYIFKNKYVGLSVSIGLIIVYILNLNHNIIYLPSVSALTFFSIGAYVSLNLDFIRNIITKVMNKFIAISLIVIWIGLISSNVFLDISYIFTISNIIGVASVWFGIDFIIDKVKVYNVYSYSFMIYALHPIILEVIEKLFFITIGKNNLGALLDYMFAPAITLIIIIFIVSIIKKISPRFLRFLSGGRIKCDQKQAI